VQRLEHLGLLDAQAAQIVDVEEAAVAAGAAVDVEEPLAQLRVAPEDVLLVGRHVIRDDVEHDPETGLAERPQLVLAAEPSGSCAGRSRRTRVSSRAACSTGER
jgi:hypothetical protein